VNYFIPQRIMQELSCKGS